MSSVTFDIFQVPFDWNPTEVLKFVTLGREIYQTWIISKTITQWQSLSSKDFPNLTKLPQNNFKYFNIRYIERNCFDEIKEKLLKNINFMPLAQKVKNLRLLYTFYLPHFPKNKKMGQKLQGYVISSHDDRFEKYQTSFTA